MAAILWICDRKKCDVCHDECRHTSDKDHAVNKEFKRERFVEDSNGNLWEREE